MASFGTAFMRLDILAPFFLTLAICCVRRFYSKLTQIVTFFIGFIQNLALWSYDNVFSLLLYLSETAAFFVEFRISYR